MKVVFITHSLSPTDGWGRYSLELTNALKKHIEAKVVMAASQKKLKDIECHPILPKPLNLNFPKVIVESFKIRPYLKDCDIIHCLIEPYAPVVAFAKRSLKKPLVITAHGTYAVKPLTRLSDIMLLKFAYKNASQILCISKFTEREILKRISLKNTCVIPNGVHYEKFQIFDNITKDGLNKVILSVGHIKPRKGYDVSIRAFAEVKKVFPNVRYYIVGSTSGTYYEFLRNLAKELDVSREVCFLGKVPDEELIKLYHLADIFVLTPKNVGNKFEGFGLVYLEANACGKPVVGTYGCGAEDAIINGYNGLLVPQNDPQKTAEAIDYLLCNPEVAKKMGENGRKRAKELTWDNIANRIIQVYEENLKKRNQE